MSLGLALVASVILRCSDSADASGDGEGVADGDNSATGVNSQPLSPMCKLDTKSSIEHGVVRCSESGSVSER